MKKPKLTPPLEGQLYAHVENWHDSATGESGTNEPIVTDIEKANVITSMIATNVTHHKVIIDLDIPAKLIPSTTPGHFHLYIDHEMERDVYFELIAALVKAGLVEPGYLGASGRRGYTAVRLPWVKKEKEPVSETTSFSLDGTPNGLQALGFDEKIIDAMSIRQMHDLWKFSPVGTFANDEPLSEYFEKAMVMKREADPLGWTLASKAASK